LITGGDGFLARSFNEKLDDVYQITVCNRQKLDLSDAIQVFNYVKKGQFDVVIHTATYDAAPKYSTKDKNKVLESNLAMFFNLARCNDYFGKMIYFGSGAEFNREQWLPKMSESYFDQYVPTDQYGFSKYIMTQHALLSDNIYNLRLFGVFGEYDDWRYRFISNVCCYAVLGLPIKIHKNARVDFLYINDLANIVRWFVNNKPRYHVYNVCSGQSFEHVELAKKIINISGKKLELIVNSHKNLPEYSGDNTLLQNELKNYSFSEMEQSLNLLYGWYDKNKHIIDERKFHF